jgi:hypothetical protein
VNRGHSDAACNAAIADAVIADATASAMLGLTERKGVPGGGMKLWAAT